MRFGLAPRFADRRGAIIQALRTEHDFQDFGWSETSLHVGNAEKTRIMVVGSRELRIVYEHIERTEDFLDAARSFFTFGLDQLEVQELDFLGVRSYWLAAVDSFDELRDWMIDRFSPSEPFSAALSAKVSDVGWVFEYRDQDPETVVRLGPMKVEQLIDQIFGTSAADIFPDQFLFLDIDRIHRGPIQAEEALSRMETAFERALAAGERIARTLVYEPTEPS